MDITSAIRVAIIVAAIALCSSVASAEAFDLQCKSSAGGSFAIKIDIAGGILYDLPSSYPIVETTSQQITAIGRDDPNSKTGGTVWIIDRTSGEFVRSSAGWFCDGDSCKSTHLDNFALKGTCQRSAF